MKIVPILSPAKSSLFIFLEFVASIQKCIEQNHKSNYEHVISNTLPSICLIRDIIFTHKPVYLDGVFVEQEHHDCDDRESQRFKHTESIPDF